MRFDVDSGLAAVWSVVRTSMFSAVREGGESFCCRVEFATASEIEQVGCRIRTYIEGQLLGVDDSVTVANHQIRVDGRRWMLHDFGSLDTAVELIFVRRDGRVWDPRKFEQWCLREFDATVEQLLQLAEFEIDRVAAISSGVELHASDLCLLAKAGALDLNDLEDLVAEWCGRTR